MEFFELTKFVQAVGPVYGMQARGTDGLRPPFQTIEEIAEYHYEVIQHLNNREPYFLVGYSAGGLVALEVARRIKQGGGEVGLLVMIDAFLPLDTLALDQLLRVKIRRKSHRIAASVKTKFNAFLYPERRKSQGIPVPQTASMQQFQVSDREALDRYRGQKYAGEVKFIRARDAWTFPLNPKRMWSPFVREMTTEITPGDHTTLLSAHHRSLAALISRYIQMAR